MTTSTRIHSRMDVYVSNLGTTVKMAIRDCPSCGVIYAVTESYEKARREDGATFYCPNGHSVSFRKGQSEADRLRAERDAKQRDLDGALERLAAEQRQHSATKGKLTKVTKRIANGVCPECNRTFANVARHMHSKHGKAVEEIA